MNRIFWWSLLFLKTAWINDECFTNACNINSFSIADSYYHTLNIISFVLFHYFFATDIATTGNPVAFNVLIKKTLLRRCNNEASRSSREWAITTQFNKKLFFSNIRMRLVISRSFLDAEHESGFQIASLHYNFEKFTIKVVQLKL